MRKVVKFLFIMQFLITALGSGAQQVTRKALFLGNSYTAVNNLPGLIANIAQSNGDSLIYDSNTPGGYTLDQHASNSVSTGMIMAGGWDYVVMQEQSQLPSFDSYFSAGAIDLSDLTEQYNPCGRRMFYMTWGRKNGDASNCPFWPPSCTYEGMDSMIHLNYIDMAGYTESEVSPVGAVWKYIRQNHPTIELYQPDESHPSEAGSYAAACAFYVSLFRKDPTQITYNFTLSTGDAALIRNAAKVIVFDNLESWDFSDPLPRPRFEYQMDTAINTVQFINKSSHAESYTWDFGDGHTSTLEHPIHAYLSPGIYQVTLKAYNCDVGIIHDSTVARTVSICNHDPRVYPDSLVLCPNSQDTLWTQVYDSYQWVDLNGDTIPNAVDQFFRPSPGGTYSVIATFNGCAEISPPVYVGVHGLGLAIYHVDTLGPFAGQDSVCAGDTMLLIVATNKPGVSEKHIVWYANGIAIPQLDFDTLRVTASGSYFVQIFNVNCPGFVFYSSDTFNLTFINCAIGIDEYFEQGKITVIPNPAVEKIIVQSDKKLIGREFNIVDLTGKVVVNGRIENESQIINLEGVSEGLYFIKILKSSIPPLQVCKVKY